MGTIGERGTPYVAKILVIDDEQSLLEVLEIVLSRSGYEVVTACDEESGYRAFCRETPDLVLLDIRMGGVGGLEVLDQLKSTDPLVPVIVMTAYSTWDNAVEAMRRGAYDFIKKPFEDNELVREVVARALAQRAMLSKGELRDAASEILGNSEAMRDVLNVIRRVAPTDSTVLVTGESGTGKELFSRALHYCSHRAGGPFLSVNCGAFPESLLESELFGHVKGAFSGAYQDKKGLIEVCDKGTFFMDEVGELSASTQVRLLRVLEDRRVLPVGGTKPRKVDVRFLCATNRDLEEEIRTGRFRADLFYRINVLPVHIPPLRERKKDIPLLAAHFLAKYARRLGRDVTGISPRVQAKLMAYHWPGNVRELENSIQRAVTLSRGPILDTDPILSRRLDSSGSRTALGAVSIPDEGLNLEEKLGEVERLYLLAALDKTDGHMTNAAKLLGISFRAMRYKVKKYDLREVP
jgi:DNA-binding NtrC family response regulator